MWQPNILETYGNQTTSYVNQTSGPLRWKYPNSIGERELITSLTQVIHANQPNLRSNQPFCQDHVFYNAYEKDIAIVNIFFGDSTVFGELHIPHVQTNPCNFYRIQVYLGPDLWVQVSLSD